MRRAAIMVLAFLALATAAAGGPKVVDEKTARSIADAKGVEINPDAKTMKVKVSRHETPWNEYIPRDTASTYLLEKMEKLKGRTYWSIYYYPDPAKAAKPVKGGDFCVFVDAGSGEIITEMRWK